MFKCLLCVFLWLELFPLNQQWYDRDSQSGHYLHLMFEQSCDGRIRIIKKLFGISTPIIFLVAACSHHSYSTQFVKAANETDTLRVEQQINYPTTFDTTLRPFSDSSYSLRFQIFNSEDYDEETKNSIAKFEHEEKTGRRVNFLDSFYSKSAIVQRIDFNNDRVDDILLFYNTGARANPTYHLYLVDTGRRKLNYVSGFEELPNPSLDTNNGIITSIALSGTDFYSFYRINSRNQLINLGHGYYADPDDTIQYERTMKKILRK